MRGPTARATCDGISIAVPPGLHKRSVWLEKVENGECREVSMRIMIMKPKRVQKTWQIFLLRPMMIAKHHCHESELTCASKIEVMHVPRTRRRGDNLDS